MKVTVGQITDRGLNPKRPTNEDNLLAMPDRGLYLVADGVGGRLGGETASRTVVEVFARVFSQKHAEDLRAVIESAIDFCNQKIYEDAQTNGDLDGMATTIALVAVEGSRAIIAHVGDSRAYRFDQKGLICLTEDHSEVNDALRAGIITAEQAANYPRRNVISRALGAEAEVEPDFREIEIDRHTSFLLCTDGVTRHVADAELARLMKSGERPQAVCQRLKHLCHQGGAEDNLTAIVVDFGERQYADEPTKPKLPAKAAQAQAVAAPPRQQSRIELDLKPPAQAAAPPAGAERLGSGPLRKSDAKSRSGAPAEEEKTREAAKAPPPRRSDGGWRIKGEMSKLMKMSLLLAALLAGVILGALFGQPLTDVANRLMGREDPYDKRNIAYRPKDPEINAAFARHLEGRSDEALARIDKVLTANPNSAEARFFLGRIELEQKRYENALGHLKEAARLDGNVPDVWIYLAQAYVETSQPRNAIDAVRRAIEVATPGQAPARNAPAASPTPAG